jgi:hypothetical protein
MNHPVALRGSGFLPLVSTSHRLTSFFVPDVFGFSEDSYAPGFAKANNTPVGGDDKGYPLTPSELEERAARVISELPPRSLERLFVIEGAGEKIHHFKASAGLVSFYQRCVNGSGLDYLVRLLAGSHVSIADAEIELGEFVEDALISCIAYRIQPNRSTVLLNHQDSLLLLNALDDRLAKLDDAQRPVVAIELLKEVETALSSPRRLLIDGASVTFLGNGFLATLQDEPRLEEDRRGGQELLAGT